MNNILTEENLIGMERRESCLVGLEVVYLQNEQLPLMITCSRGLNIDILPRWVTLHETRLIWVLFAPIRTSFWYCKDALGRSQRCRMIMQIVQTTLADWCIKREQRRHTTDDELYKTWTQIPVIDGIFPPYGLRHNSVHHFVYKYWLKDASDTRSPDAMKKQKAETLNHYSWFPPFMLWVVSRDLPTLPFKMSEWIRYF